MEIDGKIALAMTERLVDHLKRKIEGVARWMGRDEEDLPAFMGMAERQTKELDNALAVIQKYAAEC